MAPIVFPRLFFTANLGWWGWEPSAWLLSWPSLCLGIVGPLVALGGVIYLFLLAIAAWSFTDMFEAWWCTDLEHSSNGTCDGDWGLALTPKATSGYDSNNDKWAGSFFLSIIIATALFVGHRIYLRVRLARIGKVLFLQEHIDMMKTHIRGRVRSAASPGRIRRFEADMLKRYPRSAVPRHLTFAEMRILRCFATPEAWLFNTPLYGSKNHTDTVVTITRCCLTLVLVGLYVALVLPPAWLVGTCPDPGSVAHLDHEESCNAIRIYRLVLMSLLAPLAVVWAVLYVYTIRRYTHLVVKEDGIKLQNCIVKYMDAQLAEKKLGSR